jgi:uncharacterized membrane protein
MRDEGNRMRLLFLIFAAGALLCGPQAKASLTICNKGARAASVALGRFNGTDWMSEGWWPVGARTCAVIIAGPLDARYYYLYASDGGSGTWDGGTLFCTAPSPKFSIAGRGQCAQRGYDQRGFFRIDTGQAPNWTQSLSD